MSPSSLFQPAIGRSYRGRYPFRLATTSFIYRAGYNDNAVRLAPHLDEVELLLFESRRTDSLPDAAEIAALEATGKHGGLGYNVHLPIDIDIAAEETVERERSVSVVRYITALTRPLRPTSYTLHLTGKGGAGGRQRLAATSLDSILADGIDSRLIAIETLEEPFETLAPLVQEFDLSVCLDLGHLVRYGHDLAFHLDRYLPRTAVVHLHGVRDGKDHLPLDMMPRRHLALIFDRLKSFRGTLSLEVFSLEYLLRSLAVVEKWMGGKAA